MKKLLIVQYEYDEDSELGSLIVADPEKTLPNGNKEVIKILIGNYADEIYKELTEGKGDEE